MFVLPTTCIRVEASENLSPENVYILSGLASTTQYNATAVVKVQRYFFEKEIEQLLQSFCDEVCPQVVVVRGLASTPHALSEGDSLSDLEKARPQLVTMFVLFRNPSATDDDEFLAKARELSAQIPDSLVMPYTRLVRVTEFESDAALVHDVIIYRRINSEMPQVTPETLWVNIDYVAKQKGLTLGPWGLENALWHVWTSLIEAGLPIPSLTWKLNEGVPTCNETLLLRLIKTDSITKELIQSCVNSTNSQVHDIVQAVFDRGIETNEARARMDLYLSAQVLGLADRDMITAAVIRAELMEHAEGTPQT